MSSAELLGQFVSIVGATFVSEDLTCIGTGLLIHEGRVGLALGLLACFLGIVLGDLGLWLVGRVVGVPVLAWPSVKRRLPAEQIEHLTAWFDRQGWQAVLAARFLPGARLPIYLAAGALGQRAHRFTYGALLAAALWTPLVVLAVVLLGNVVVPALHAVLGATGQTLVVAGGLLFCGWRLAAWLRGRHQLQRLLARISKCWRWEFWPGWLFYLPLLPWLGFLTLRYRGPLVWTAANPGIPDGGVVGESKAAILDRLPRDYVLPYSLIATGSTRDRLAAVQAQMAARGWQFPVILKPDASQRGAGLKLAHSLTDVAAYIHEHPAPLLVQVYHPGPYEAGVFYYRRPGERRGRIFSITDKHFPSVTGNGRETLAELIWKHPRYRMQAPTFLERFHSQLDRVLADGESLRLAIAGNHCQGTMFCDGAHLVTDELERVIDRIARQFAGFYIGRFDVRYGDVDEFMAGRDLAIVELNGATSESTNIYDPAWSLMRAYGTLGRQWQLLFAIGASNRARGAQPSRIWPLLQAVRAYYRTRQVNLLAD
ncbi:MAG: VTT domain-containing protein [Pirellulales bacterium]|nr:VTT domain-containing protein [Pirellulales bacterium]